MVEACIGSSIGSIYNESDGKPFAGVDTYDRENSIPPQQHNQNWSCLLVIVQVMNGTDHEQMKL